MSFPRNWTPPRFDEESKCSITAWQDDATILYYAGMPLVRISQADDGKYWDFHMYDPDREAPELLAQFYSGEGLEISDARALLTASFRVRKYLADFKKGKEN